MASHIIFYKGVGYMITNKISQQIWEDRYRKNNETLEDNLKRVANYIATNKEEYEQFYNVMNEGLFYPAGRTMSNAGIGRDLTMNNCFTLNLVPDSMEGIYEYVKYGAMTQKAGGGTGYNFSLLRPNGTQTSNDAVASGVVSFISAFDCQTHTVLQGGRRGANMGCLLIYHPDILEFLESKSWDEGKLTHFNLSVLVDDDFMKAKDNNEDIYLHFPCMDEKGKLIKDETQWVIKKKINALELWNTIMKKAYDTGEYGVLYYDNMNNDNNTNYMETIVTTNPCGEYLSGVLYNNETYLKDYFGACNLGSLFLHNFVNNPFTEKATVNWDKLKYAIKIAVRMLDNIIDINKFPLQQFENYQKNMRTIGLGITSLADMMTMLNIKYGSKESVEFTDELMNFITFNAYDFSCDLALEKGEFNFLNREKFANSNFIQKHIEKDSNWNSIVEKILLNGIRNARLISIAPVGTLSLSFGNNCSSGLEPIFSLEYERKIKIGGQSDDNIIIYPMRDYAYDLWLNTENNIVSKDVFVTAMDLDVQAHIDILATVAYHTDMSCSKTINVPMDYPFEKTKDIYAQCWERGIKGVTIFRPNPIRQGILISENDKKEEKTEEKQELSHGEWMRKPDDTVYHERKVYTGCSKLILFIGWSAIENRVVDVFVKHTSKGGCKSNIDGIVILMSGMLRYGGSLKSIQKAIEGVGVCNSFINARNKQMKLSKGSSCPSAILNTILDFENEMKGECKNNLNLLEQMNKKNKKDEELNFTDEESNFLKEYGEVSFAQKYNKCPICGNKIEHIGGCVQCNNCSWTKC